MSEDLKPCPCGASRQHTIGHQAGTLFRLRCHNCEWCTGWHLSKAECADEWNNHAETEIARIEYERNRRAAEKEVTR